MYKHWTRKLRQASKIRNLFSQSLKNPLKSFEKCPTLGLYFLLTRQTATSLTICRATEIQILIADNVSRVNQEETAGSLFTSVLTVCSAHFTREIS